MAQSPSQVAGVAAESAAAAATAGYLGWSPTTPADRALHTVLGGAARGTYANSTAYAIGDVVLYNGVRYQAIATVSSGNSTPPALGATWRLADDKRGAAQQANVLFRTYR